MPQPNPMAIFENHPPTQHNGILATIYNPGLNGALVLYEKRWLCSVKEDSAKDILCIILIYSSLRLRGRLQNAQAF